MVSFPHQPLNTLKQIFSRYTAFIWGLLQPLGAWGVFGIAFADAAFLGLPLDPIVATYVYADQGRFWMYVLLASAGSALGSSILYGIGRKGGELLLTRQMSPERLERMRRKFEQHEFLALMLPAMLPPPVPFKLFVLSAAVFQMDFRHFLLAIFAGRIVRFSILSLLTIWFGPHIVHAIGNVFREHPEILVAVAAVATVALAIFFWRRRRNNRAATA